MPVRSYVRDSPALGASQRRILQLLSCRALLLLLLIGFVFEEVPESQGQSEGAGENQVKAAYLYNFAKFASWPKQSLPEGAGPLVIGVVDGNDEFASVLRKTVDGRSIGSHPIVVRRLHADDDLKVCQLIFFRASERKQIKAAIASLDGASALLVGEDEAFLRQGGMINLILRHGKIRFDIDRAALDQGKVQLSPQLLALADSDQASAPEAQASSRSRQITVGPLPEYPEIAQRMNLKGTVRAEAVVRPDGTVREVRVTGGHPVLADALVKAVKGWRYERSTKETVEAVKYVFDQ